MPCACVLQLEAVQSGCYTKSTGVGVHGWWFDQWQAVDQRFRDQVGRDPGIAGHLHRNADKPFTLSPLMGLPASPPGSLTRFPAGQVAWLRFCLLSDSEEMQTALLHPRCGFLAALPDRIRIGGIEWRITALAESPPAHPWAGQASYATLLSGSPVDAWEIELATPTLFNGNNGTFPFPLPGSLVESWLRRWNAFCAVEPFDDALSEAVRAGGLAVQGYALQAETFIEGNHDSVGCTGRLAFTARRLTGRQRKQVDALARFSFYCGSGRHTAQGMGLTRPLPAAATMGGG